MATYQELRNLFDDSDLREKLEVGVIKAAETILTGADSGGPWDPTNHTNRVSWAASVLSGTAARAEQLHKFVLASNSGLTVAQIQDATDASIQTAVNSVIDELATAEYGA